MEKVKRVFIRPNSSLNLLSHREIDGLTNPDNQIHALFKQCALAVLNTGVEEDDASVLNQDYNDFAIRVIPESRGIKLEIENAPANAFVNGRMINGIQDHLFSVLRDIVYTHHKITSGGRFDFNSDAGITDAVFRILRNAGVVKPNRSPNLIVCWGGHAIQRNEYDYTKDVGYHLGLRGFDIATGCGVGAMKGPMKGAVIGHGKQQIRNGRYLGITEPGIIASESPNPTVNELVVLPDIEKRLEAFVRLSHGIIVFPGGAGTAEEVLFLLGLLMHPDNHNIPMPLIFTAPQESAEYFSNLDNFIAQTLGKQAQRFYQIVIGDPEKVATLCQQGMEKVHKHRRQTNESYAYNWMLTIPHEMQQPFDPTHDSMRSLKLDRTQPPHLLAAELRRAFSGIVAGNVKASGIERVKALGPFQLTGDETLIQALDELLGNFIKQGRMKIKGAYKPCFKL
ncbi:nucleotide 5'-monophosphate nucleosidase PpnN [Dasania sp. GY-MA-18]|uniref:AMP nucleosidase n=1 Tax=Dasania phycosphaerae TaxID=2950436 RepID=A0A9J6RKI6_9GAMM|nr:MULTISPECIES: nucleotide 5'-monophosphate nucleosidase PpnN [Dasania]MCR8922582.1 nucleotide 5'-monophosphate nucleosidase PpnN [Dasania sp. GY-MA-18]MCZ0865011.1 nucleotide 5'-monophosphate nucleosidase PpnN [Dasania phycosphaerae]MCZ0868738.1 nucleotide 5'-monophosphate nucleosidase PpnN [Dasania phycosphaerae]